MRHLSPFRRVSGYLRQGGRRRRLSFFRLGLLVLVLAVARHLYKDALHEQQYTHHLLRVVDYDTWTKKTAAICCIVRDEEPYLNEWLDFHLGLGFSHVYIYDNSPDFDLRNWKRNQTTIQHFPGQGVQSEAYLDCVERHLIPNKHRWVAFIDVDEFLVLYQHASVVDFLASYCPRGALAVNWRSMSWSNQSQYAPAPVTKRFQYMAHDETDSNVHHHVKSMAYVLDLDLSQAPKAHYPFLKPLRRRADTDGMRLKDDAYVNFQRPSNVALLYHYHTKSWKEYIDKRSRGRAAIRNQSSVPALIEYAKQGKGLREPMEYDDTVWQRLKQMRPEYKMFDGDLSRSTSTTTTIRNDSPAIALCTRLLPHDEFYIDEWLDYHLALGVSHVILYDLSEEHWMKQWGNERRKRLGDRVSLISWKRPLNEAAIHQDCLQRIQSRSLQQKQQRAHITALNVNEFIVVRNGTAINSLSQAATSTSSASPCALLLPILLFGTSNELVFEPMPVTKRFLHRIEGKTALYHPILKATTDELANKTSAQSLIKLLPASEWSSSTSKSDCTTRRLTDKEAAIFQYRRSTKECRQMLETLGLTDRASINKTCTEPGTIFDNFAWVQLKRALPSYKGYDTLFG